MTIRVPEGTVPVLFAVHNDLTANGGKHQFVERSYLIPTDLLPKVYALLDEYEMGDSHRVIEVET